MPKPFDFGGVNLTAGEDSSGARPSEETPFCIAILGDFSGRANRGISDAKTVGKRRAWLVDRDNFDEVLARSGAEIQLPMDESGTLRVRFSEIDDFHPDRIFQRLEIFGKLRDLRARLQDPSSFEKAAELGLRSRDSASQPAKPVPTPTRAPSAVQLASGSLLDDMIAQTESRGVTDGPRRPADEIHDFAQRVVAQHLVSTPDPRQPEIVAVIDRAIGSLMRAILHNPEFQALEAAWRAVFLLVRQLETGSQLKLYLVDISKPELAADLSSATDLRSTGAYRLLVGQSIETPGAEPWSIIVGNYSFGSATGDAEVLSRMARIASRARAPFLGAASPRLLGCSSWASTPQLRDWKAAPPELARAWVELRRLPEANAVGLALPRFLLRLPYGKKTAPLESFDFEEFPETPAHEDYLWGNPGFAVALLLAQSFSEAGWGMRPGTATEIDRLPLHICVRAGESESKPCSEVLLSEDAVERILEAGLMPLVSFKDQDRVRLGRFQSVADPPRGLAGRWGN
ncbi:MAG: type VI secretion system contractile sheath domain-containing protein [Candidatus Sulfotelmatobacter sp.]